MNSNNTHSVTLEGFHVCKHAVRFQADVTDLVTSDRELLLEMLAQYAPDTKESIIKQVRTITQEEFDTYSDVLIRTPLMGQAVIPQTPQIFTKGKPLVFLENPRDLGNIGAVVRLAAGMDIAGVVTSGEVDPWHKNCLRGSQGLHFALPVVHTKNLAWEEFAADRTFVVFDESGQDIVSTNIPHNSVLVFGSERQGVSKTMLEQADLVVKIPQREKVSSYNLATSVAIGLYATLHTNK